MFEWGLLVVILGAFVGLLWSRRRLYWAARTVPGVKGPPFLGAGYLFLGKDAPAITKTFMDIIDAYPDLGTAWFGNDLYYLITKPEYLEAVLNSPGCYNKPELYDQLKPILGDGLITAPAHTWKRHRKILAPAFNQKILNGYHGNVHDQCEVLLEILEKKSSSGGKLDIARHVTNCALDVICATVMGFSADAQKTDANYSHLFDRLLEIVNYKVFRVWYHFDFIYKRTAHYKEEHEIIAIFKNVTRQIIEKRKRILLTEMSNEAPIEETKKSFINVILEQNLKDEFTLDEVEDELNTFLLAGTDTNATSTCFVLTLLGMECHADIQEKVYEEVLDVIGPDRAILLEDLPNLKYTECVIKESLRLFPGAPFSSRRVEEDVVLDDGAIVIPKGACAVAGMVSIQRRAKYWPDPLKFDPDRFLPKNSVDRHPYCWIPFSRGPRNCIGSKFAMMAMKTMIPLIIRKFRVKSPVKRIADVELKATIVLKPKDGFHVSLEKR